MMKSGKLEITPKENPPESDGFIEYGLLV